MTRSAMFVASVGVLCLTLSVDARAEPIRISGGTLDFNGVFGAGPSQPGFLSIVGNRGFSVAGIVESGETRIDPVANCFPCPSASTISLGADIRGSGFSGSVTLDGQTHTDVNGFLSPDSLVLELSGTIDLPAWRNAPVTISAPFEATGHFQRTIPSSFFFQEPIGGRGRATLNLTPDLDGTWALSSFRYDFNATPTPEPATFTLVTGALVSGALRARKRRDWTYRKES